MDKTECPKILILNNRHPKDGVGRYAFSLFSAMRRLSNIHAEFLSYHHELFRGTSKSLYKLLPYFAVEKFIENNIPKDYALYHITNHGLMSNVIGKIRPSVVTVHDLIPLIMPRDIRDAIAKKIMIRQIPRADAIICISEATKRDLLRFKEITPDILRVIHNGVDHALFKPRNKVNARRKLGLPINKRIILHVGSEESRKNVPILIESFSNLRKKSPEVVLIRIGKKTKKSQKLIKTFELEDSVLYFGAISEENLALFYNAADIFVFPSYLEGFGMPLLEAMSSGIPVISTNVSALTEIVEDSGTLVDPFDADTLTYWMNQILTDQDLQEKLGAKALQRSMKFDWMKCAKDTLRVYEDVLER